jgi:alcohol dehydrogenase, propanol-preferring
MKAARLHEFGKALALEEVPLPRVEGDEVLVRVHGAGVCHTDLHIAAGSYPDLPLPRVLGHEISGFADGIGDVLVYASWGCGTCPHCREGEEQLCPEAAEAGWLRDGGYAEYVRVPSRRYLLPLQGLDPIRAAPLADAGVTPLRAVRRIASGLAEQDRAVVIGIGGLGQFALQYLRILTRARIVAVDRDPRKLAIARALGCAEAVEPERLELEAAAVLDFVGSDETLTLAARVVRRGGIVAQIGEGGGRLCAGIGHYPHEAAFTTSIWGSLADLRDTLDLARRGQVRWEVERLPLASVNEALDRLRRGDVRGRLVLTP